MRNRRSAAERALQSPARPVGLSLRSGQLRSDRWRLGTSGLSGQNANTQGGLPVRDIVQGADVIPETSTSCVRPSGSNERGPVPAEPAGSAVSRSVLPNPFGEGLATTGPPRSCQRNLSRACWPSPSIDQTIETRPVALEGATYFAALRRTQGSQDTRLPIWPRSRSMRSSITASRSPTPPSPLSTHTLLMRSSSAWSGAGRSTRSGRRCSNSRRISYQMSPLR
jgi:hypothetical protein